MDVAGPKEPEERPKSASRTSVPYRRCAAGDALLAVVLCAAGFLCVTLLFKSQEQGQTEKNDDLQHVVLREISRTVRAAIHLEGEYNSKLNTSVEWKKDVDQYHSEGGLKLEENEIVIPHNGLYFVYSQASFRVSCQADEDDDADDQRRQMVHLSHSVKRWSDSKSEDKSYYETILQSVRTACEKTPSSGGGDARAHGKWFNAVYMGAVFRLNAGDRLKTVMKESLLRDVDDGPGNTFFGVFAL
ncbi:hypothetical protein NHX12_024341 [Muraenolepis orangiensis]|uniref:THD domain-containing protein n=1 Tax=Muraenolepis orangiensis TaxID=630683 RepID=A0A9Q0EMR4_9TELE|nr:hypothetical protein NHX12_024341 [Muraenolepis orangiensis]